jgi:hypothetical protein
MLRITGHDNLGSLTVQLDQRAVDADADQSSAALAAELTAAAYPVALRHAVGEKWLDLELELWRALTETVKKWIGDASVGQF